MKRIGLIGGLSPESTIEYYKNICRGYNDLMGKNHFPQIVVRSLDLQEVVEHMDSGSWNRVAHMLSGAALDLRDAGCNFAAIASNTPHIALDYMDGMSSLEFLSIVDATSEQIKQRGHSNIGLIGTRFTMENEYFQRAYAKNGLSIITPNEEDRRTIDEIIWHDLTKGALSKEAKEKYLRIVDGLGKRGAEGVILGCTEIPLLVAPEECPIPAYDTTKIHSQAILEYALRD